ncbi:hypothetical protein MKEN_00433500 [Mycena kentingensis (nom. inval.)]|nr:hypothetical protein MKEN_00433500 [Mycena kentingensis (nom. inval.)]
MSFAQFASQYLNKQGSSTTSAQPLFFSFTTDEASVQLDDADDPHFGRYSGGAPEEEDDPYLRLDEDDDGVGYVEEADIESEGGWLAHQRSPAPSYRQLPPQPPQRGSPPTNHAPQPQSLSLALSQSLLPRSEREAHAFTLPHPYSRRHRLGPQPNAYAAAAFLFAYTGLCVCAVLSLVLADAPDERPPPALLHTIPLVTLLTLLSAVLAYAHLALLRAFIRPVLLVSALAPPFALFLSAIIAFAGLPILTLLVRLPLSHSWYMQLGCAFVAACAMHVFFVARSLQRSIVAGGVGAWYFRYSIPPPSTGGPGAVLNTGYPELDAQIRIIHGALLRPLGPIVLSALFSLILSILSVVQVVLYWLPLALPYRFIAVFADIALSKVHSVGERIGGGRYTGVYCGLTGSSFWDGARGVKELRSAGAERAVPSLPLPRPYTLALPFALVAYLRAAGDRDGQGVSYMEQQRAAVVAAVLAGLVCAAVGVFCAGVVRDCADTLYVCHLIDRVAERRPAAGDAEREEIWGSFDPSPANRMDGPQDAEALLGLHIAGFNIGGLFAGGGANPVETREQGGRGEEPAYARLRRADADVLEEEMPRRAPSQQQPRRPSRGFKPPSQDFSAVSHAVREYSPPPRARTPTGWNPGADAGHRHGPGPAVAASSAAGASVALSRQPPAHAVAVQQQPVVVDEDVDPFNDELDMLPTGMFNSGPPDSDGDSLDSGSGRGGESSSAFPGSGFF